MTEKLTKIVYVSWEESERGWGTRPDGCSLHLTEFDYKVFLKDYWRGMPEEVPDEYSRPAGNPVKSFANSSLINKIKSTKNGLRIFNEDKLVKDKSLVYSSERSGWVSLVA
jgi:hypothetical protein